MFFKRFLYWLLPRRKKDGFVEPSFSGGALKHISDSRDYPADLPGGVSGDAPVFYTLRGKNLTRVEHQGLYNSCVAHAFLEDNRLSFIKSGGNELLQLLLKL